MCVCVCVCLHVCVCVYLCIRLYVSVSGITRPGPTRACALPSTFQALSSPTQQELHDFIMNYTKKKLLYLSCSATISVSIQQTVNLSINTLRDSKYIRPLSTYEMQWLTRCILILKFQNRGSSSK